MKSKTMINPRWTIVMIALTILTNHRCSGKAIENISDSLTRQTMGPYSTNTEEVQKHVIYLNGTLSAEVTEMLAMFNMSVDELKRQQEIYKARRMESQNSGGFDAMTTTEMSKFSTSDDEFKNRQKYQVRTIIEEVRHNSAPSTELHETAYPPNCTSIPLAFTEDEWFDLLKNTWNIFIMPKQLRDPSVTSVVVRIFKKLTNNHAEIAHDEHKADELYTVKLSIYVKKRIQQSDASKHQNIVKLTKFGRKADIVQKVEISSATILKEYCGWIEFSVPSLRKHWDSPSKNLGLAVDIYDSSNRQLTAKDHFSLQSCEEGVFLPWTLTSELFNGKDSSSCFAQNKFKMHKDARIDLTLTSLSSNRRRHARHIQHHHQGHLRHLNRRLPNMSER